MRIINDLLRLTEFHKIYSLPLIRLFHIRKDLRPKLSQIGEALEKFADNPDYYEIEMEKEIDGNLSMKDTRIIFQTERKLEIEFKKDLEDEGRTEIFT